MVKNKISMLKHVTEYLIARHHLESFERAFYNFIRKNSQYRLILKKEIENLLKGIPLSKSFKITKRQVPELLEIFELYSKIENLPKKEKNKALRIFNYLYEINESFLTLRQFLEQLYMKITILNIMLALTYSIFPWLLNFFTYGINFSKQYYLKIIPNFSDIVLFNVLCLAFVLISSMLFSERNRVIIQLLLVSSIYWSSQMIIFIIFGIR